ncbi:unnamed protein product, partial [Brassica rapa]
AAGDGALRSSLRIPPPSPLFFMALAGAVSLVPPWPPDVCVQIRDPRPVSLWSEVSPASVLFPEVAPAQAEVAIPLAEEASPVIICASSAPATQAFGPSISPSSALWVSKLKSSAHNLKKLGSPSFAQDGTPIVQAPDSVVFHSSNLWKGYLVAQFHGDPPSPAKIFTDLNPIWGKNGRIKSVTSAAVNGWTRVASKSSPPKSLAISGKSKEGDIPVTSSQFDSEEVLISEAQQVIRNRLAAAEADFPPFSSKKDKKYYR